MRFNTEGLIIREQTIGESDRLITVLTADYGIIRAFVRNAARLKSKLLSSTQLMSYSRLSVYRGRDSYIIDEAEPNEVFFGLRESIEKISLAQYFCELCCELAPEEDKADGYLSLMLNSLYLLSENKSKPAIIKATFELRMMCMSGYMPNIVACENCGTFETDTMYFDTASGNLYCEKCHESAKGVALNSGVVAAMRHICYEQPKKIFNFKLSEIGEKMLSEIAEKYLLTATDRRYKALEFYKALV